MLGDLSTSSRRISINVHEVSLFAKLKQLGLGATYHAVGTSTTIAPVQQLLKPCRRLDHHLVYLSQPALDT